LISTIPQKEENHDVSKYHQVEKSSHMTSKAQQIGSYSGDALSQNVVNFDKSNPMTIEIICHLSPMPMPNTTSPHSFSDLEISLTHDDSVVGWAFVLTILDMVVFVGMLLI
jgi:hypothetical protein